MQTTNRVRPVSVSRAVGCFLAALALTTVASGIAVGREAYLGYALGGTALATAVLVVIVGFYSLLVYMLALGRNWARITYALLFAIGAGEYGFVAVANPHMLSAAFAAAPVQYSLCVIAACLAGYALWQIFRAPGNSWFTPMRAQF